MEKTTTNTKFNGFASEADYEKVKDLVNVTLSEGSYCDLNDFVHTLMVRQESNGIHIYINDEEYRVPLTLEDLRRTQTEETIWNYVQDCIADAVEEFQTYNRNEIKAFINR